MTSPPYASPRAAIDAFLEAVAAKDEGAATMVATKTGWNRDERMGVGVLFDRLKSAPLDVAAAAPEARGDRATASATVSRGGQVLMAMHLLLEERMGSWRLAGVNPSKAWASHYLAGDLPALLDLDALPPEPEVVPLAEELIGWLESGEPMEQPLPGTEEMMGRWMPFVEAPPGSTFIEKTLGLQAFGRAAVSFITESPTKGRNRMWLVVQRAGKDWEIVWFGHDFGPGPLLAKLG